MEFTLTIILLILLSGFIKGFVGFGMSLLLIGALLNIGIEPSELMPILVPLFVILDILLFLEHRKHFSIEYDINISLHPTTLMATFIGTLLGTALLLQFDVDFLKIVFAVAVLVIVIVLISKVDKHQISVPDEKHNGAFGLIAGIFTGLFTLNGIIATIYLMYHQYPREKYMVTLVTFLLLSNIILVSVYLFANLFTIEGLIISAMILGVILIGFAVGSFLRKYVSASVFKSVVIVVLAVNSIKILVEYFLAL
ncbi:MAG: TSUP family transporter [Candidatus Nanoarchaeia archaeon]